MAKFLAALAYLVMMLILQCFIATIISYFANSLIVYRDAPVYRVYRDALSIESPIV